MKFFPLIVILIGIYLIASDIFTGIPVPLLEVDSPWGKTLIGIILVVGGFFWNRSYKVEEDYQRSIGRR